MGIEKRNLTHKHHIIPRHMGGTDDPSNIVEVSVEQHALLHKQLWEDLGHWEDKIAWQCLSGLISVEEARRKATSHYMSTRTITDQIRTNMSEGQKRRCASGKHPMLGKKFSLESRKKMSESHKGKPSANKGNKYTQEQIERNREAQLKLPVVACKLCGQKIKNPGNMTQHMRARHKEV